jgi:anti-anti-sigma factor
MGEALVGSRRSADGTVVVEIRGELDIVTARGLRELLVDQVSRDRPTRIVVDMRYLSFMDSTGIGALVGGYGAAREAGVEFSVCNASAFVYRQLRITGLTDIFACPQPAATATDAAVTGATATDAAVTGPTAAGGPDETGTQARSAPTTAPRSP